MCTNLNRDFVLQGTVVGALQARDQDMGNPNPIRMSVVEGEKLYRDKRNIIKQLPRHV